MSDLTPQERDELVSAYLDGEATAEERAMVEADSDLLARADQFRHAAEEVASPVAEAGRAEIIAYALDAAESEAQPSKLRAWIVQSRLKIRQKLSNLRIPPNLRDRLRNRRLVPVFGVAAALVVVFLAITVFVLISEDTGDDSDVTSSDTTQTSESVSILESAAFQAAFDEVFDVPATTAAAAAIAPTAAASATPTAAPSEEALESQSDAGSFASPQLEEPAASELRAEPEAFAPEPGFDDADLDETATAYLGEDSAGPSVSECPTDQITIEESPEADIEGELEDTEEFSPDGPPSIERPDAESSDQSPSDGDSLPETSLNVPEPPAVIPSPPPEDDSARPSPGSPLIIDGPEDAPLVECP